jgi:hypothetical protein
MIALYKDAYIAFVWSLGPGIVSSMSGKSARGIVEWEDYIIRAYIDQTALKY